VDLALELFPSRCIRYVLELSGLSGRMLLLASNTDEESRCWTGTEIVLGGAGKRRSSKRHANDSSVK
jgi:hypothetical protein